MDKVKVFEIVIENNLEDETGVDFIALVDQPAIMKNWMAFNSQENKLAFKSVDNEKRLIMGAAMIPDLKIYRHDAERGDFYVYFSKDTISDISKKYHRKGFSNNVNVMHDPNTLATDVYVVESFITDEARGISDPKGFDNPEGTWYVTMHVDNDTIWNDFVKTGQFKGFSVEGLFNEIEDTETKEDKILKEIDAIIKSEFKK